MLLKKYKDLHGKEQKKQVELNAVVKDTAFWDEHNINVINFKDISIDKQVCLLFLLFLLYLLSLWF